MSMGTSACVADVIGEDVIKKFCPKEWQVLENERNKPENIDRWEEIAQGFGINEDSNSEALNKAYHDLQIAFKKKTGLGLDVAFHDPDTGDKYDSELVHGVFWCLDGVYQLSPAGKKMEKYFSREFFTQFG